MRTRLLILAAFSLAVIACVNETPYEPGFPGEEITIHAGLESPVPATRTLRNEGDGSVLWAPGDCISVFYGSGTAGGSKFTSQNTENSRSAEFKGTLDVQSTGDMFWGVYPYYDATECDGSSLTVTLPSLQTAAPGTFAPGTFISIGRSENLSMSFYNLCGGVRFRVSKQGVKRVTLRSFDGPIAGKVKGVFDGSGHPVVSEILEGSDAIVLEAPDGQTLLPGNNYYFSVLPHEFGEHCFAVTFETGSEAGVYDRTQAFTVSRSVFEYFNSPIDSNVSWAEVKGIISTPAELQQFLESDAQAAQAGDSYLIVADIDMSGVAIASAASFAGVLDGGGRTISGISSSKPLIESLSGTVKNLTLGGDCSFTPAPGCVFGTVAGTSSGTISNVVNKASVSLTTDSISEATLIGGIAGRSSGTVSDCRNEGNLNVTATGKIVATGVAGLVAYLEGGVSNCTNKGEVSLKAQTLSSRITVIDISNATPSLGGVVAYGGKTGFSMQSCDNYGPVSYSLTGANVDLTASMNRNQSGGVVGSPSGPVNSCNNYGDVNVSVKHSSPGTAITANEFIVCVGGIGGGDYYFTSTSGTLSNTSYINCVNEGNVTVDADALNSNSAVGGIVGWPGQEKPNPPTAAEGCVNRGTVTIRGAMKCRAGGIEGGTGVMRNCTNEGTVHMESCAETSAAGSLCGFHSQGHEITGCTAGGSVVCDVTLIGGVAGLIGNAGNVACNTATGCKVLCPITVQGSDREYIGVVVGKYNGTSTVMTLGSEASPIKVTGTTINGAPASLVSLAGKANRHTNHTIYSDLGTDDGSPFPNLPELTESSINGTTILASSNTAGLITNASTGAGIPGVAVTDGYSYVVTDANGVYQMTRDSRSRKIYYTTPAEYKISLDPSRHLPAFFTDGILLSGVRYRADFSLEPLDAPETEFTLVMIGDPQCYQTSESKRYANETIKDIKATANKYPNVYAMTLGDITFDSTNMWETMVGTMSNVQDDGGRYIPFFQTIGNHDHNSLMPDTDDDAVDDYNAVLEFVKSFGPTDYSFDRGDAHIVSMDDVVAQSIASSGKPNGHTWNYSAGFSDEQYEWFKQDLANVSDKGNKVGFLCLHIPMRAGSSSGSASVNKSRHYADFLKLMKNFKEFHIMIGHTHYQQNYLHTGYVCTGGCYIYEHVHGAACGAWWASDCNVTGGPNGYCIYTVNGPNVTNWLMKGSNRPESYQMRVYDGNDIYAGTYQDFNWYSSYTDLRGVSGMNVNGFAEAKGAFVVEVFNDDSKNWKLEFWQNGAKVGNFTRRADKGYHNVPVCSYWINKKGKKTTTWTNSTASHYWYYKPASGDPSSETNWEVRAIQTIPTNTSQKNTYICSTLTKDYSGFEKP